MTRVELTLERAARGARAAPRRSRRSPSRPPPAAADLRAVRRGGLAGDRAGDAVRAATGTSTRSAPTCRRPQRGEIDRLLINVPPRHMKSLAVSVMWPAWSWTFAPAPALPDRELRRQPGRARRGPKPRPDPLGLVPGALAAA